MTDPTDRASAPEAPPADEAPPAWLGALYLALLLWSLAWLGLYLFGG